MILATDFIYSFVIFNYCSNELVKPVLYQPTVVVIKDEFPVISSVLSEQIRGLFGVAENRIIGQYIFRVDKIDCSNHPMFYCIIGMYYMYAICMFVLCVYILRSSANTLPTKLTLCGKTIS